MVTLSSLPHRIVLFLKRPCLLPWALGRRWGITYQWIYNTQVQCCGDNSEIISLKWFFPLWLRMKPCEVLQEKDHIQEINIGKSRRSPWPELLGKYYSFTLVLSSVDSRVLQVFQSGSPVHSKPWMNESDLHPCLQNRVNHRTSCWCSSVQHSQVSSSCSWLFVMVCSVHVQSSSLLQGALNNLHLSVFANLLACHCSILTYAFGSKDRRWSVPPRTYF